MKAPLCHPPSGQISSPDWLAYDRPRFDIQAPSSNRSLARATALGQNTFEFRQPQANSGRHNPGHGNHNTINNTAMQDEATTATRGQCCPTLHPRVEPQEQGHAILTCCCGFECSRSRISFSWPTRLCSQPQCSRHARIESWCAAARYFSRSATSALLQSAAKVQGFQQSSHGVTVAHRGSHTVPRGLSPRLYESHPATIKSHVSTVSGIFLETHPRVLGST